MRSVFKELQNKPKTTPEFKTCPTCNQNKPASEYNTYKKASDNLYFQCKSCTTEARNRTNSAPKIQVDYKKCSKCKETKPASGFYNSVKTRDGLSCRCSACMIEDDKNYRRLNPDKVRETKRKSSTKSLATNTQARLAARLRIRINKVLKGNKKVGSAVKDLGCTLGELKEYLESLFQEGMTWDNWSRTGWHIDHIIPLASFDLSNRDEFLRACHYTNLQPLWAEDNYDKRDRLDWKPIDTPPTEDV